MIYIATYIRKLKDRSGNYITPATRAQGVYMEDNTTLSLLSFYPVGSIFQSTNSTSPASLFGGSWERIQNRFLYGSGTYSVSATGGEEKHTLSIAEMPGHAHHYTDWRPPDNNINVVKPGYYEPGRNNYLLIGSYENTKVSESTGGGQSHNNMPPYYCVNIWRRTA